jgi:hypothetical protein
MPSFAFPYTLEVNLSLPLSTPQGSLDRSPGLSSPRDSEAAPHLFVFALIQDLAEWQNSQATLLQYIDDLLFCGPTEPVIS